MTKYWKYLLIVIGAIVLDQLSKYLIVSNFDLFESLTLIPGFLKLNYVRNTGAGFSILEGQMGFFYTITVVALIFMAYMFVKSEDNAVLEKVALAMMFGGAVGNFIDRLRLGYVVDFIAVDIFSYHFPVFNIADSFLTIGVILFIAYYLFQGNHGKL